MPSSRNLWPRGSSNLVVSRPLRRNRATHSPSPARFLTTRAENPHEHRLSLRRSGYRLPHDTSGRGKGDASAHPQAQAPSDQLLEEDGVGPKARGDVKAS